MLFGFSRDLASTAFVVSRPPLTIGRDLEGFSYDRKNTRKGKGRPKGKAVAEPVGSAIDLPGRVGAPPAPERAGVVPISPRRGSEDE